ncbi:LysR family transcriptional regulator [Sphingomonas gilva]|uniref:LysR family transcriptional regulator n=1 Tax=Sphingomonas gilva TaxID=2305907 RepID=A0A396RT52_9SPHN|nr:LysR substrate-binding domain-containing protein [Sphingomonas gilva]RHW19276.1 LysR family transcriptional regulator [Sphingomonas gilva]
METRRLEYFLHIADAGSISKAAQNLEIAQPAMSRQLAILEHELRCQLVERSPHGIRLTEAGRSLYTRAQIIVRQVSGLRFDVGVDGGGLTGSVAIGLPPSHERFIGIALVAETLARYPQISLQVNSGSNLLAQLHAGTIDLALAPVESADASVQVTRLFREELVLVQSAGAPPPPTDIAALAELPWIVTRAQSAVHGVLATIFQGSDLQPRIAAEIGSLALVLQAVQRGLGVTVLPRAAILPELARGEVSVAPAADPPPCRIMSLCLRRGSTSIRSVAAVAGLIEELVKRECGAATGVDRPRVLLSP